MKQIPKYQWAPGPLPSDNTRVVRQPVQYQIQYTPKPGEYIWTNRDGSKTIIRGKNAQVSKDTRNDHQRKQDQSKAPAERKRREMKDAEAKTATVVGEVLNRTMPSTIARAAYDATTGDKSFAGSMIEGNEGLGHPVANLAFDVLAPMGIAKGFQYAADVVPRVARFGISNHTGNWTQFGNSMYRLKPGYVGMNGVGIEKRSLITPEDLTNRKFFSVEEYGTEPIYTRETAPTRIRVKEGDITESHMNDGTPGSEVTDANKVANEWFNKANHGQIVSYETDHSLSTDSYPIALLKMNRWQQQGLGQFVQSETAPEWMRLNKLGNKSFEELQEAINRVNRLTGQNYKIEQRLSPVIGANGQPTLHPITGQPLMANGIYVQPVGFFKYKKGNKIRTKFIKR